MCTRDPYLKENHDDDRYHQAAWKLAQGYSELYHV